MPTPFDDIRELAFDTILERMGQKDCTWISSIEGYTQTATILFREPTDERAIAEFSYNPQVWYMEWKQTAFTGLDDAVDAGNNEMVTISGTEYWVRHVHRKYDGFNFLASLEKK